MSQGTGPEREDEDIVLPSWIDAAISRTRSTGEPLESPDAQALPEEAVEPMADEVPFDEMPTAEYPRPVPPLPIASAPSTEPFPTFLDRRESMRVSWYSSLGTFDHDRSGRDEDRAAIPYIDNTWAAPSGAAEVRIWVVLRDDRGGVAYRSLLLRVE